MKFILIALTLAVIAMFLAPFIAAPAKRIALAIGEKAHDALFAYQVRSGLVLGMTTLAANKSRDYEIGEINALPMIAADIIYEGAAVGDNGAGLARPLVAADPFLGFANRTADNSTGAASAVRVELKERGRIVLAVTGVASADDVGTAVYASDDDTFTLTSSGNSAVGKVSRWISGTTCLVNFEGVQARSI